jgi:hypothetical protein
MPKNVIQFLYCSKGGTVKCVQTSHITELSRKWSIENGDFGMVGLSYVGDLYAGNFSWDFINYTVYEHSA